MAIRLILLFVAASCLAQDAPSHFLTKSTLTLLALDASAKGSDAYFTRRNIANHGIEQDPFVRPFVHNTGTTIAWAGGFLVADVGVAYLLHKRRHDKLAHVFLAASSVLSAEGAAYSGLHP